MGDLSYGERRLLAIARAVATSPSVLLLDEPAAGLSDDESRELAHLVRRLAEDWGMGVLLVEHDVDMVMSVCDEVVVLDFGRRICVGTPEEVRGDPAVRAAYLGDLEPRRSPRRAWGLHRSAASPRGATARGGPRLTDRDQRSLTRPAGPPHRAGGPAGRRPRAGCAR